MDFNFEMLRVCLTNPPLKPFLNHSKFLPADGRCAWQHWAMANTNPSGGLNLAKLAETNLMIPLGCEWQTVFVRTPSKFCLLRTLPHRLFTKWLCAANSKDFWRLSVRSTRLTIVAVIPHVVCPHARFVRHLDDFLCVYQCLSLSGWFSQCWLLMGARWQWPADGKWGALHSVQRCNYGVRGRNQAWTQVFRAHLVQFHSLYLAHRWEAALFYVESSQRERDCL